MSVVDKARTYSNGQQLDATNYNADRDEIIAGVNSVVNAQVASNAGIEASKIADTAVTLTAIQTVANKTLTSPVITGVASASPTTAGQIQYDSTSNTLRYGNGTSTVVVGSNDWSTVSATLTYSATDGQTFVATTSIDLTASISVGMKFRLTQTTVKYFFVTAITATTITLYGGTDYTLISAGITAPATSSAKAPFGFPLDQAKWTQTLTNTSNLTESGPTVNTWYNTGSLSIALPIGAWNVSVSGRMQIICSTGIVEVRTTLSTGTTSESNQDFTSAHYVFSATQGAQNFFQRAPIVLTSKTTYYVNLW